MPSTRSPAGAILGLPRLPQSTSLCRKETPQRERLTGASGSLGSGGPGSLHSGKDTGIIVSPRKESVVPLCGAPIPRAASGRHLPIAWLSWPAEVYAPGSPRILTNGERVFK